jgi:ABC-2 type transport system permease protein
MMKAKSNKSKDLFSFAGIFLVLILLNILGSLSFFRIDLTSEKRYTLNPATKTLLDEVEDVMFFRIYLDGNLPPAFQKLKLETRQMLDEFRAYNPKIQYKFINPSESEDRKVRRQIYEQLEGKGLYPIEIRMDEGDNRSQMRIFPGALVGYLDYPEIPMALLLPQLTRTPEEQINSSIQNLEYSLANTVRRLTKKVKPRIAIIRGQGQLEPQYLADLAGTLSQHYHISNFNIREFTPDTATGEVSIENQLQRLRTFDAAIIARPTKPFTDLDLLLLDQFIMSGGKTLWFVDAVEANMDSLSQASSFLATPKLDDLNLRNLLFKYGARINTNLVKDLVAAGVNDRRSINRWVYFPMVMPQVKHPITKDLNAIKLEFASTVDTVLAPGIKKTFLLKSSPYARSVSTPHIVSLATLYEQPRDVEYQSSNLPFAVLLEGSFESYYRSRIVPRDAQGNRFNIRQTGNPTKMLVVGDGDLVKNQLNILNPNLPRNAPLPLGFDQFTNTEFGNKDFVLNAVDYMLDDMGLISIRSRELKLRLLDARRVKTEKNTWKVLNTAVPIGLVLLFGLIYTTLRKRRYAKKHVA